jgi:hypothetical protein
MATRRGFLAGLLAAGMAPQTTWAGLGGPAFLSAAKSPDGRFLLAGLTASGDILFRLPLPGRGHAAAAHPHRAEAVAFARRPGRFADVIDCTTGRRIARLEPAAGHHFYGHGVFSPDGGRLFTTENDYENARGVIGIWDAGSGYRRAGSFGSGGIGPHDLRLRRDVPGLVVANGGIETHPDSGRAKLNIPAMRPNLSYLGFDGTVQDVLEARHDLRLNSIRHLSVAADGTVGFAMQWQGDAGADVPIAGLHRPGNKARLLGEDDPRTRNLNGYGGSIAFSADAQTIAVTSPRGGVVQVFETASGAMAAEHRLADVCGLAALVEGFAATDGRGRISRLHAQTTGLLKPHSLAWDNHLIPMG